MTVPSLPASAVLGGSTSFSPISSPPLSAQTSDSIIEEKFSLGEPCSNFILCLLTETAIRWSWYWPVHRSGREQFASDSQRHRSSWTSPIWRSISQNLGVV